MRKRKGYLPEKSTKKITHRSVDARNSMQEDVLDILREKGLNQQTAEYEIKSGLAKRKWSVVKPDGRTSSNFYHSIKKLLDSGSIKVSTELISDGNRLPKPIRVYMGSDNVASKKEVDEIFTQFEKADTELKPIVASKLNELAQRRHVIHPEIVDFLRENIQKGGENLRITLLGTLERTISVVSEYYKVPSLISKLEKLAEDKKFIKLLSEIVKDNKSDEEQIILNSEKLPLTITKKEQDTRKDAERYRAASVLVLLNQENALDSLLFVLEKGSFFVEDGGLQLFQKLYKLSPDLRDKMYDKCRDTFQKTKDERVKEVARKIIGNLGL